MGDSIRLTYPTAMVLQALERGLRHGFDIIEATGVRSGTVYPVLRRLQEAGLVQSEWEDVEIARSENRPARKYYELTDRAQPLLRAAKSRFPALAPIPDAVRAPDRLP